MKIQYFIKGFLISILLGVVLLGCSYKGDFYKKKIDLCDNLTKEKKLTYTHVASASTVLLWGFTQWGYGEADFHFRKEGLFERETANGGADKLGHFYTNYLITRILAPLYGSWGYERKDAALYAALTAGTLSGLLIEAGDGISNYGFSHEDLLFDLLGVTVGYFWHTHSSLSDKVDFRLEFVPSFNKGDSTDFTTNYEHMKHLLVIKGDGFKVSENSFVKYMELHIGYYTRDFNHNAMPIEDRKRHLYIGLGFNLSRVLEPYIGKYAKIFNYYQMPYTYLPVENQY